MLVSCTSVSPETVTEKSALQKAVLKSIEQHTKTLTQQLESDDIPGGPETIKLLLLSRASNYLILKNYPGVIKDIEALFSMGGDLNEGNLFIAHFTRGVAYMELGNIDEALDDLNKAEELQHDNIDIYLRRGLIFSYQRKAAPAILNFKTALKLDPKSNIALTLLGAIYFVDGQFDKALEQFNLMIDLELDPINGYLGRMKVMEALGRSDDAARDYQKAIELGYEPKKKSQ